MVPPKPRYTVGLNNRVKPIVARFSATVLGYWNAALGEIADDPTPRVGTWAERLVPIRGWPWKTYTYWITEETTRSNENAFVFIAEFLPHICPVFLVNESAREIEISHIDANRWF